MHGLFPKYYAIDVDVSYDPASSAIWDEKLQNGRKKAALLATTKKISGAENKHKCGRQ